MQANAAREHAAAARPDPRLNRDPRARGPAGAAQKVVDTPPALQPPKPSMPLPKLGAESMVSGAIRLSC